MDTITPRNPSRRRLIACSLLVGLALAGWSRPESQPGNATPAAQDLPVTEADVIITTPDGACDAAFIYPKDGTHPGVLIWPDYRALRPAFRDMGRRLAAQGYCVLIPNHLYRMSKAPVFSDSFDLKSPADHERYQKMVAPFQAEGAADRDATAFVGFLDTQPQVDRKHKLGVQGYCFGGSYALRTAAAFHDRIGAAASFHGGGLATDKPDSPHLLAPKIKAHLYIAVAGDDDTREPEAKTKLREAFAVAKVPAEVEVYPNAKHGWCVPDSKAAADAKADAEKAWSKLLALYKAAL